MPPTMSPAAFRYRFGQKPLEKPVATEAAESPTISTARMVKPTSLGERV